MKWAVHITEKLPRGGRTTSAKALKQEPNWVGSRIIKRAYVAEMGCHEREKSRGLRYRTVKKRTSCKGHYKDFSFYSDWSRKPSPDFQQRRSGMIWQLASILRTDFESGNEEGAGHKQEDKWGVSDSERWWWLAQWWSQWSGETGWILNIFWR